MFRFAILAVLTLWLCAGCADEAPAQCANGQCAVGPGFNYGITQSVVIRERAVVRTATAPVRVLRQARPVRRVIAARPVRRLLAARPRLLRRLVGRGCR